MAERRSIEKGRQIKTIIRPDDKRKGRDVMTVEQRSACMSKIRGKDTGPECQMLALLQEAGITAERHARELPGRPDFVVREARVAIFVDGDFWHGWRFPVWRHKLAPFWEAKIAANRARDGRNHARLRAAGWRVVRVWEHQLEKRPAHVRTRIAAALGLPECQG
jgi:DNA mismatch endonuclease (patch repair protein)